MKIYTKTIDNKQVVRPANKIVIHKDGFQTINPTEEMILADGWVEYVTPTYVPTEEELLNQSKERMIERILQYDSSDEVNIFYVGEQKMWLDKPTRVGLKLRFETELEDNETNTTLWYDGIPFELPLENAIKMLHSIERYASKCYDNTQKHIGIIKTLTTIDEVEKYNFMQGYPNKLYF